MWNSLGSLRERVREHAKSAAQAAQGVLQAAAAEEDSPPEPEPDNNQDESTGWGGWGQSNEHSDEVDNSAFQSHDPVPPPPSEHLPTSHLEDAPPPPPPEDSFVSAKPPVLNAAPRSRRGSRYVVTGVATAQTQGDAPAVPKPSFFAPKPPVIGPKPGSDAEDETADKSEIVSGIQEETSTLPPADKEEFGDTWSNVHDEPNHARAPLPEDSASPGNYTEPENSAFATSVATTVKADGDLSHEQSKTPSQAEGSFANWGLPAEQQNGQSTAGLTADGSFAGWSVEASTTENGQPENLPAPTADGDNAAWNVPETVAEQQQSSGIETKPVDDSFSGWGVSDALFETTLEQQKSQSTAVDPAKEALAGWNLPDTSVEQKESLDTAEAPAEDSFAGWGVPKKSTEQQPAQNAEISRTDWTASNLPESAPETSTKENEIHDTSETPEKDSFAGWAPDAPTETTAGKQGSQSIVEDSTKDDLSRWNVAKTSAEQKETHGTAETPAEDGFAPWGAPEPSTEQQQGPGVDASLTDKSFTDWGTLETPVEAEQSQNAEKPPQTDGFSSWSVPETSLGEQESQRITAATTDDSFATWNVPIASTGQQHFEQNSWDIGSSETKPNEARNGDDSNKEAAFTHWGDADDGWNIHNASSAAPGEGDGADWFSSGTASADVPGTADKSAKDTLTAYKEPSEETQTSEATEPKLLQNDSEPLGESRTISEEPKSRNETTEKRDVMTVTVAELDSRNAEDTSNARKDDVDDRNHESKFFSGMAEVDSHNGDNGWGLEATAAAVGNGLDNASTSAAEGQRNLQTASVIKPQESVLQNPIITSDPVAPIEAWFSDRATHATQDTLHETIPQGEAKREATLYEPKPTSQVEHEAVIAQSSEMALQVRALQEQIRCCMSERDSALAAREASARENDDLKRSIGLVESDLAQSREESGYLTTQRDTLERERNAALEQKMEVEKERDEAIQRGGEGLREARSVIEAMRSNRDSTEKREAAITEQIGNLRTDVDRISEERNTLLAEAEDLRVMLKDAESQSRQREDELRQRLRIAEHECEIVRLEREKALETNELHMDENRRLGDSEKSRAAALAASESRVVELENYIASTQVDREDENVRIELFSNQIGEMKDRTQGVIDERNRLYDEKCNLENQIEEYRQREEGFTRDLQEAKREASSLASERDEAKQKCLSMKDQQKELVKRVEAIAGERDQLVQARTAATAKSQSVSEKEKALVIECEQKTRALAILQKKLASAVAKIEKVTAQRGTFQRQRDEAGARLRAAGLEFVTLNSKLEELSIAKNTVQNELVQIRDERDAAMSRVEEMISLESQLKLTQDGLDSKTRELEDMQSKLKESKQEAATMQESNATAHQKASNLARELSEFQGRFEVVSREKDLINTQKDDLKQEKTVLQQQLSERERSETQLSKRLKSMEADYTTVKEKSAMDLSITKAELASEQELHRELQLRMSDLQSEFSESASVLEQIRRTVLSCAKTMQSDIDQDSEAISHADLQCINNLIGSEDIVTGVSTAELVSRYGEFSRKLFRNNVSVAQEYKTVNTKYQDSAKLLVFLEQEKSELQASASEAETLRGEVKSATRDLEAVHGEKVRMESEIGNLQEQLSHVSAQRADVEAMNAEKVRMATEIENLQEKLGQVAAQRAELEARLEAVTQEMHEEMQRRIQSSTEERDLLLQETEKVTTNLNSIWSMLRKSLGDEQMETLMEETGQYREPKENVAVLALRATASIVAEVSRNRSHVEDAEDKLLTAEAEVARLIDRAEIAEQERDTAKGTNERLERKIRISHGEGQEEAKAHYERITGQLEDELEDTRQELSRISDKANRSEKETVELRALCSKLTSQFNGRTNELDEAEEKVVYLQDQVTTLEEDLEDAHARLKKLEEESAEARQSDVKRLTDKLEDTTAQLEEIEKECSRLRGAHDEAESIAKESRMLANTHKQAEENLQIAIEQLEAAQESAVEQRTIELQKKLEDAERRRNAATERETAAAVTQKQLSIRDDEIKELRGAIGRLADERVELKLELEKNLSRLNHPDAGGQLVDRRVVRQLLVSYFRVGSVRRRDVLELMSRMLAFSDRDNIAVGLKRRALMDRLGSLVQAPELDDASLPPLGTVSDKWIEFLMKETEEGEEQARGW